MQITFLFYRRGGVIWEESQVEKSSLQIMEAGDLEGALRISDGEGTALELQDDFAPLIGHLCFSISRALQQGDHAQYSFFSYHANLELVKEGDRILLRGDKYLQIPAVSYDAKAFITALYDCGCRFLDFLHRLRDQGHPESETLNAEIGFLEEKKSGE